MTALSSVKINRKNSWKLEVVRQTMTIDKTEKHASKGKCLENFPFEGWATFIVVIVDRYIVHVRKASRKGIVAVGGSIEFDRQGLKP